MMLATELSCSHCCEYSDADMQIEVNSCLPDYADVVFTALTAYQAHTYGSVLLAKLLN